jgi:hypothetical protein
MSSLGILVIRSLYAGLVTCYVKILIFVCHLLPRSIANSMPSHNSALWDTNPGTARWCLGAHLILMSIGDYEK